MGTTDGAEGTWYPTGRLLADQLQYLVEFWPAEEGRIARVLFSPPDWDDKPRSVAVSSERRIKTGSFPRDDTHSVIVTTLDTLRHTIAVNHLGSAVAAT
jgi:hypothetical protein